MTTRQPTNQGESPDNVSADVAQRFVAARLKGGYLTRYPGQMPTDLAAAYRIQGHAIDIWPDRLRGWKVGRIPPHMEGQFGCDRLAGPIFEKAICRTTGESIPDMAIFSKGFAAVEAEFVAVIGENAPADKLNWSPEEAETMIGDCCIGLEVASSPLATINDLGPAVTISDFGNNAGLIVGHSIADWRNRDPKTLTSRAYVDEQAVGEGGAYTLTGGIIRSVQFILELAAKRDKPLRRGDVVATGQTSGIHQVIPGQRARITFGSGADGEIACRLIAATDIRNTV